MRALVTGASGFVGPHLTRHLLDRGSEVTAIVHPNDDATRAGPEGSVDVVEVDILDDDAVTSVIESSRAAAIYHLAAFSNPQDSLKLARRTLETNIVGANNVLAAAARSSSHPRVLLVGSAQQYGNVAEIDQPIDEDRVLRPLTPYAVSKASQELLGLRYFWSEGVAVFLTRSFNHTGPGQADRYVCSSFARQVVEVERNEREPLIRVGNLEARRDFTDVRDVARAYTAILDSGRPGRVYNVCRGEAVSIREVLDTLIELSDSSVEIVEDPTRYHAADAPLIVGDNGRLREDTQWRPSFDLRETLSDLLEDWRKRM